MTAAIPTTEPAELRAGDTWKWTKSLADYSAADGWVLKYRFKNAAGGFEITATASGSDFSISVAADTTTGYTAGTYEWTAWIEYGGEVFTVDGGTLQVLPNLRAGAATAALDTRSHARKTLDAIEAVIENRATLDQMSYTIAGRTLQRMSVADLIKFKNHYAQLVQAEVNADKLKKGLGIGGRIQFRT